jgi:hypothetical protein
MNVRKISLAVAAIALTSPALSSASTENTALTACAQAFATSLGKPGGAAPTFKIAYRGNEIAGSMVQFYTREYTFELQAHDPKTGSTIARASCSADVRGNVLALSSLPSDAVGATLANR